MCVQWKHRYLLNEDYTSKWSERKAAGLKLEREMKTPEVFTHHYYSNRNHADCQAFRC